MASVQMNGNKAVTAHFLAAPPICGRWSPVLAAGAPAPRLEASAVWDPVRHRVLMFGGFTNEVWQLTTSGTPAWTQITPLGTPPSARYASTMVYDPVRDRLLIFGGRVSHQVPLNDVWALSLGGTPTWTQITPAGTPPGARGGPTMVYHPGGDRLVIFGGVGSCGSFSCNYLTDTWSLSLGPTPTWTQLAPTGSPPFGMFDQAGFHDSLRDRLVVMGAAPVGGFWAQGALSLNGTPNWSPVGAVGMPHATNGVEAIYDPVRDRGIFTGGQQSSALALSGPVLWSPIARGAPSMGGRTQHITVYDPDQDVVLIWGGTSPHSYVMRLDLGPGHMVDAGGDLGSVLVDDCFEPGATATLVASPKSGYAFNQWLGDASGSTNPVQLTMDGYKVVQAQFATSTGVEEDAPLEFALGEIAPNPSAGAVKIAYSLPRAAPVRLGVFDVSGRLVTRLVEGVQEPGRRTITWDGVANGTRPTSGIYFVRFETPVGTWVRRVALVR